MLQSRSKSTRRLTATPAVGRGGVDLISGLSDGLLLRILYLLPEVRDAVRTQALSRRWRGLWTRVPALRLDFNSSREFCRLVPKQRQRAATLSIGDGDGDDLISNLTDDVLLHILDLLPDARDVVRTHALSRRWRGLWTGAGALRFYFDGRLLNTTAAAAERYLAFINSALALCATTNEPNSIRHLAISFYISGQETRQVVPLSMDAAQGWIRYAMRHAVKSLVLKLKLPWLRHVAEGGGGGNNIERRLMTLDDEIGNWAKMETMHLRLGYAELRLPSSTVAFKSLTDLSLEDINLPAGGGYLLCHLGSSACCPCLHKLWLAGIKLSTMEEVLVDANALLELTIDTIYCMQSLGLRTPSLRVLRVEECPDLEVFTVSAPRLQDLTMLWEQQPLHIDDVRGHLSSVRTLKIQLFSHGEYGDDDDDDKNDVSIRLLQCCRLTRCLQVVSFEVTETEFQTVDIIKGRIPPLPHVTRLAVSIILWEKHSSGPGVACLLAQCSNVKYLSLELCYALSTKKKHSELCDNNSCHWKSHDEFSLAHLQEVHCKNLVGTDCEFPFIRSILTKATGIQKVTIGFDQTYWLKGSRRAFKLMPALDGGSWTTCKDPKLLLYKVEVLSLQEILEIATHTC